MTPVRAITPPKIINNSAAVIVTEPMVNPAETSGADAPAVNGIATSPARATSPPPIVAARLRLRF